MAAPENRLGVVGLGNMGGRIALRLQDVGHDVIGYDVDPERAAMLGLKRSDSLSSLVDDCDVVLLSLPDSSVVEPVMRSSEGLLGRLREGQVVVDLSTASPRSTVALAGEAEDRGASFLDAGVSGGAAAAEKGTLTIMVGGAEEALDRVRPLLEGFSTSIVYMGRSGSGHITKLLNNFLNAVSLAASAEVMVAGYKAGLDLHDLLDVLNSSSGVNFATLNRFPKVVDGDYLEGGLTSRLMMKDVVLYLEAVRDLGVPSLNASGPVACFGLALQLGYGDEISNRVVDAIGDTAGGTRVSEPPAGDDPQA